MEWGVPAQPGPFHQPTWAEESPSGPSGVTGRGSPEGEDGCEREGEGNSQGAGEGREPFEGWEKGRALGEGALREWGAWGRRAEEHLLRVGEGRC